MAKKLAMLAAALWAALLSPVNAQEPARRAPAGAAEVKLSLAPVVREASPAVVNVYAQRVVRQVDPWMQFFGQGQPQERVQQSLGSGVLVRADGVVVTNNHVIQGAERLKVVLADRREFDAKLLLADPKTDLAVLRLEAVGAERLPVLEFSEARATEVGDFVIAIGNPFGLNQTVTSGIVSALARTGVGINDLSFFVQTDAPINRGNSGGALIDLDGRLVGVNSAIVSEGGGSNGIGFAIPSALVRRVVEDALSGGRVVRPWVGARTQAVTYDLARSLGLDRPQGVILADLSPLGPLAKAGLRKGDVLLAVNNEPIYDPQGLRFFTATLEPNSRYTVDYLRDSARAKATVRAEPPPNSPTPDERVIAGYNPLNGAKVANLSPALAEELGVDSVASGVVVAALDARGFAYRLGFQAGDIVRAVNGVEVRTTAELARAVAQDGRAWRVAIIRNGQRAEQDFRF